MATRGSLIFISVKAAQSPSDGHDEPRFSSHRGRLGIAQSSSDGHDDPRSSSHLGDTWTALDGPIFIERAAEEHRGDREVIAIRRPGCARSFSHLSDASGRLDLHRTDDDRPSAGDDRDHHLPDRDQTPGRLRGRIPRLRCNQTAIAVRSSHDRGTFGEKSWPRSPRIDGPCLPTIVAINRRPRPDQMAEKIGPQFPLKSHVFSL